MTKSRSPRLPHDRKEAVSRTGDSGDLAVVLALPARARALLDWAFSTRTGDRTGGRLTSPGPPPSYRTLARLIEAAANRKCPYCKAEPQVPCTWPGPDKYHVARFKRIGMTEAERHSVEAATRLGIGHTGPKGYLVGELRAYHPEPEPEPELEADIPGA